MSETTGLKKMLQIQKELKVPKTQKNKFGNYLYRSAEDIIEEAKKVLNKHDMILHLQDEVVQIADRVLSMVSGIPMGKIAKGQLDTEDFTVMGESMELLSETNIFIDDK